MAETIFMIRPEHFKLAERMWVGWDDCEFGAPAIDPKRPYGNSDVLGDIHEILTGQFVDGDDVTLTEEQAEGYARLHGEMQTFLQIVINHAGQIIAAGDVFRKTDRYNALTWERQ